MPYPDDTSSNHTPFQHSTKLSETEKHWNQIVVAFIAIGTTILTAILLAYRFQQPPAGDSSSNLIPAALVLSAAATYTGAFIASIRTIFLPPSTDTRLLLLNKRNAATTAISLFTTIPIMAVILTYIVLISPILDTETATERQSPTQSESNGPATLEPIPSKHQRPENKQQGQTPEPDKQPENGDTPTPTKETLPQETSPP